MENNKYQFILNKVLRFALYIIGIMALTRIFVCDRFLIPSDSMAPCLNEGDIVYVNKLLCGPRIYKSLNFERGNSLKSLRLLGIRKIRPNDVICFNYPYGYDDNSKIEFRINYVYCKRVLGTPGDRIGATDGHYWNDKYLKPIGYVKQQNNLRWTYDSIFLWNRAYYTIPLSSKKWNIKNWGPLIVPAKNLHVKLDDFTRELYRQVIEYEMNSELDDSIEEYTFTQNYYFAVGDNVMESIDSRYWGFIPEDFIIGIVGGKKVRNNPYQTD